MPDTPAQDILLLTKSTAVAQTETNGHSEELYALKRIAEVEQAISELAKSEPPAEKERKSSEG